MKSKEKEKMKSWELKLGPEGAQTLKSVPFKRIEQLMEIIKWEV